MKIWAENGQYPVLEKREIVLGESIGLGDDWDQVDSCAEALHDLNVQRLKPKSHRQPNT